MKDRELVQILLDRRTIRGRYMVRMVAAWPRVAEITTAARRLAAWAEAAMVPLSSARQLAAMLQEHEIVEPGGRVHPDAEAVLAAIAADELEAVQRRRSKPKDGKD